MTVVLLTDPGMSYVEAVLQRLQNNKYRLYDEGEVVTRFIHRVPKARGVLIA